MANMITVSEHAGGEDYFRHIFAQLSAVGATDPVKVHGLETHVFQVTAADIDTNVVIRLEGSLDGVNYGNLAADAADITISADGTYLYTRSATPVEYVRVRYVSETGSTTPTVDVVYVGRL